MEELFTLSPKTLFYAIPGIVHGWLCGLAHDKLRFRRNLPEPERRNWRWKIYGIPLVGPWLYLRNHRQWKSIRDAAFTID